ncbi:MAG: methyltransferase domain-containing protein [Anaerolineae bacterium]
MLPRVYREFERICTRRGVRGAVLEVGAIPSEQSLLCMKSLTNATEKIGINLDGPSEYRDFKILKGNANCLDCFEDDRFDAVLCNATLEHDKFFWKTVAEIRRVTRPAGLIVIGTPGYTYLPFETLKKSFRLLRRVPIVGNLLSHEYLNWLSISTITVQVHNAPGDYYRFSPQAFREVFFEGMRDVEVYSVMFPPIIIGSGINT